MFQIRLKSGKFSQISQLCQIQLIQKKISFFSKIRKTNQNQIVFAVVFNNIKIFRILKTLNVSIDFM